MEMLRLPNQPKAVPTPPPAAEAPSNTPAMEIAHVLFMDVVGFSQLRMQQQAMVQVELQNLVQATPEVQLARKEGKLIVRPTGDGMALLFLRDMLSPIRCALQIHGMIQAQDAQIKQRIGAPILLRMGIHSGSVLLVEDMNAQSDVAGEGIIIAQRVMDCGDAGHILVSEDVARKLLNIDPWPRYIKDIGEVRVKHGVKIHLYNLVGRLDGPFCGNPATPKKVKADTNAQAEEQKRYRGTYFERNPEVKRWLTMGATLALIGGGVWAAWTKVPAVPQTVQAGFAQVSGIFGGTKKAEAADKKSTNVKGTTPNKGTKTTSGKGNGGSSSSYSGNAPSASSGPRMVMVPNLLDTSESDARATMRGEGVKVSVVARAYNSNFGEGQVFKQSPAEGKMIPVSQSVKLWISRGEKPAPEVPVEEPAETVENTEPVEASPPPEENTGSVETGSEGAEATESSDPRRPRFGQRIRRLRERMNGGE